MDKKRSRNQQWLPKKISTVEKNDPQFVLGDPASEKLLDSVPDEIFLLIFSFLDLRSLLSASRVNKQWRSQTEITFADKSMPPMVFLTNHPLLSNKVKWNARRICNESYQTKNFSSQTLLQRAAHNHPKVIHNSSMVALSVENKIFTWKFEDNHSSFPQKPFRKKLSSKPPFLSPHKKDITDFQLLDDGSILSSSIDRTACLWHPTYNEKIMYLGHTAPVSCVHTTGNVVISGGQDCIKKYNKMTGKETSTIKTNGKVYCLRSDTQKIVAGTTGTPMILIGVERDDVSEIQGHKATVYDVQIDGNLITSGSYDGLVKRWDLRMKESCFLTLEDPDDYPVFCVNYNGEYRMLTGTAYHSTVRVWDIRYPKNPYRVFADPNRYGRGIIYSISSDESCMFVATSNMLQLYQTLH